MGDVIEINDGLISFAGRQGPSMFMAFAVGEVEEADGDAG